MAYLCSFRLNQMNIPLVNPSVAVLVCSRAGTFSD
uniref:Uncharacterized protein n=1 Tax=Anguilla anguilla TaxID=7936 RepID=A0A0E9UE63_ANGAN